MNDIANIDEVVLKLLHYFITDKGYNPIVLHGAQNEIWLEKINSDYKIIRIVTNYIHNDEQYDFDSFKTNQILKKVKKQTLCVNMNVLNIFLNLGDNVHFKEVHNKKVSAICIESIDDLNKYDFIKENFPDINENTDFKEEGLDLFLKITNDLNQKSLEESKTVEKVFKIKKPIITYSIIAINIIVFIVMFLFLRIILYGMLWSMLMR